MKCNEKILIKNLFCVTVPFIELAVSHTSVLTILAITVERLVHPFPPSPLQSPLLSLLEHYLQIR